MNYLMINKKKTRSGETKASFSSSRLSKALIYFVMTISVTGCASNRASESTINTLHKNSDYMSFEVNTSLPVKAFGRLNDPAKPVHIYIEGDGRAWRNNHQPSTDPTPSNPVALKLAQLDESVNVLYIARPCQYNPDPKRGCHFRVWTEERFAHSEVIESAIKQLVGSDQSIVLIGFSGGANIAVQLATKLDNVEGIITLAGNLDSATFARFHRTPLERYGSNQSLLIRLMDLPQLHISGSKDQILPPNLTHQMMSTSFNQQCHSFQTQIVDHHGPWQIDWTQFYLLIKRCNDI